MSPNGTTTNGNVNGNVNGNANANGANATPSPPLARAKELSSLLSLLQPEISSFIDAADAESLIKADGGAGLVAEGKRSALVDAKGPGELEGVVGGMLGVKGEGVGMEGLVEVVRGVLGWSVNTWDQGFMDKLYASPTPIGLAADLLLTTLNTNSHVYAVSPLLTLIEKHTARHLCTLFNLPPATSGGITQPGGSASNATALVVARNTLFPETKTAGLAGRKFTLFTSAHGHYSLEKAANLQGLGSNAVRSVPIDETGRMIPSALDAAIAASRAAGEVPFFVNATAGTTVLGSFDPFDAIAEVCKSHGLWLHVDGSWGGSVVYGSAGISTPRLAGVHRADSIAINPHKMLGMPVTCSFLLARDLGTFHRALTLPAGYLFHHADAADAREIHDLADLTPQCGRRADAFKFWLALQYHGSRHFTEFVDTAFERAAYLLALLKAHEDFVVVSSDPLPCLQVCFYYARGGELGGDPEENGRRTAEMVGRLVRRGFMVDFAPGKKGKFFRVVVNGGTRTETLDGLVKALVEVAGELGY